MIMTIPARMIKSRGLHTATIISGSNSSKGAATVVRDFITAGTSNQNDAMPRPAPSPSYHQALKVRKQFATHSCQPYHNYLQSMMMMTSSASPPQQLRMFSTQPTIDSATTPLPTLENLNAALLERIRGDFKAVDDNRDGQMQPEEFRNLLRMNKKANFTESEIELVTECFYAGTGGRGVTFDRFLEAVDAAAANAASPNKENASTKLGMGSCGAEYILGSKPRHVYTQDELNITLTHKPPEGITNTMSLSTVKAVRYLFDAATGWNHGEIKVNNVMNRVIYLETIAAVPGMVAGILRHFKSLRAMERDGGMLNMFLEEALNERMHLLTFVQMKNPGALMRAAVLGGQLGFGAFYGLAYIISPKFCHSFVGYVEEEACSTYTKIIQAIESAPEGSDLAAWRTEPAPEIAKSYWHLGENGTVLDVMYAVRADEAEHRDVNHFASEAKKGDLAPVCNPKDQVDMALRKYVKDLMTV